MTYKPASAPLTNPFWIASRSTSQQLPSVPNDFSANTFTNCTEATTSGRALTTTKAFCVGELRVQGDPDYNLFDTGIAGGGITQISQGYQVRSNGAGSVLTDDACYGTAEKNSEIRIRALDGSTADTSAGELRILGVRTK
jgi:hypothetical protein